MADENEDGGSAPGTRTVQVRTGVPRATLESENYQLRHQRKDLRAQIANLTKRVPPEGAIVLTAEQGKLWAVLLDRKIDSPDKLAAALDEAGTLKEQIASRDFDTLIATAAEVGEFPVGTLRDLVKARGLRPEIRTESVEVTEGGEKKRTQVQVVYLGTGKDGEQALRLNEYVEQKAPEYATLIGTAKVEGGVAKGVTTTTPDSTAGRRVASQASASKGGGGATSDAVKATLERNRARAQGPNALRPAVPAAGAAS